MKLLTGKFYLYLIIASLVMACAKETSNETGRNINGPSLGTLKDSLGNCKSITINGTYKVDTALNDNNFVLVQVNVTTPGQYIIYSDTANGFWFRDSGYTAAGQQTIKLKGYGKPLLFVNTDFIVTYNNSFCIFQVPMTSTVVPPVYSDYFPTSVGSNWAYDVTGLPDTLHLESTSLTKQVMGNSFRRFRIAAPASVDDSSFFRKSNGDYYQYKTVDPFGTAPMEYIMLKDNQPVATQWDSPTSTTSFPGATEFKIHFTILAKNTSLTVNNMLFDSVIRVQYNYQYKVAGNFQTISTGDTYYAKNVGLIKVEEPGVYTQAIRRWKVYP